MSESWRNMSWPRAIYFVFSDWWCFNTRLPCTALVGFRRALCTDGTDSILSTLVNFKLRRNDVSTQITPGFQNSTSNVSRTDWPIRQLKPPVHSRSWLATTEATNCPDRMPKNLKSKSMGDVTVWVGHPVALTSTRVHVLWYRTSYRGATNIEQKGTWHPAFAKKNSCSYLLKSRPGWYCHVAFISIMASHHLFTYN